MKISVVFSIMVLAMLLACNASTWIATPTPVTPVSEIILTEVLQKIGCMSNEGVRAGNKSYSFICYNSADTSYGVSITSYGSESAAQAEFESNRGKNPLLCFHGYDLYETSSDDPNNQYIVHEDLGWQAGQWFVSIGAGYDYGYSHYTASDFSEAVYSSSVKHNLFPAGTCP